MPGMIEGHSHLFLHPYNETPWDDQVLHEPLALRTARATVAARATLAAGFTTVRDLGTEGAGYADVGLKQAINQGVVPGPRMVVATRALVATGAYGPRGFEPGVETPLGAEAVDGPALVTAVRRQIGNGADVVFDPVGGDVFDESVRCIAFDGRLLVIGFTSGRIPSVNVNMPLIKGFSVVGVRAGEYGRKFPERGAENLRAIAELASSGRIRPHVCATFPLERTRDAMRLLEERRVIGKVIVQP
jgi:hypothetical protein